MPGYLTMNAAQNCRSHLGITSQPRAVVTGEIDGNVYSIIVTLTSNEIAFDFDDIKICGFSRFSTIYQNMEWDSTNSTLTISSSSPNYEFEIDF